MVADTWWHAHTALEAMPIEWDYGPGGNVSSSTLLERHMAGLDEPGETHINEGNVEAALGRAARVVEAT